MRWMVTGVEENPGKRRCQARKFWLGKMIIFLPEKVPKGGGVLWVGSKEESITKQLLYIGEKLTWKSWGNNYSHPFMSKNRVEAFGEGELSISFFGGVFFFLSFVSVYGTFSIIELIGWMLFDQKKKVEQNFGIFSNIFLQDLNSVWGIQLRFQTQHHAIVPSQFCAKFSNYCIDPRVNPRVRMCGTNPCQRQPPSLHSPQRLVRALQTTSCCLQQTTRCITSQNHPPRMGRRRRRWQRQQTTNGG